MARIPVAGRRGESTHRPQKAKGGGGVAGGWGGLGGRGGGGVGWGGVGGVEGFGWGVVGGVGGGWGGWGGVGVVWVGGGWGHAAARFTPLSVFSGCPTERRFANGQVSKAGVSGGFLTLPARMHEVHSGICVITACHDRAKRFRLDSTRGARVLFAWLITFPRCGAFAQNSHFSAFVCSRFIWLRFPVRNIDKNQAPPSSRPSPLQSTPFGIPDVPSGRGVALGRD